MGTLASTVHRLYQEDMDNGLSKSNTDRSKVRDLTDMIYGVFADKQNRRDSTEIELEVDTLLQNKSAYLHKPAETANKGSASKIGNTGSKHGKAFVVGGDHFLSCDDSSFYYSSNLNTSEFYVEWAKCRFATGRQDDADAESDEDIRQVLGGGRGNIREEKQGEQGTTWEYRGYVYRQIWISKGAINIYNYQHCVCL